MTIGHAGARIDLQCLVFPFVRYAELGGTFIDLSSAMKSFM